MKFLAFGKSRATTRKKPTIVGEGGSKEEKDTELLKRQVNKIEEQIMSIKSQKLGRVGSIFKMKEAIEGAKKKVALAYCVTNLSNISRMMKS